jgi:type I restriction enzyme S subunit
MKAPKGWRVQQLSDLANVVRGSSPRPAGDPRFFDGNYLPWITVAELTKDDGRHLWSTKSALTLEGANHTRIIEEGTLLLTNSGATLGVPKITKVRAGANDGIAAFLNLTEDRDFMYFALQSRTRFFREGLAPGVGQPNLNTELIGSVVLPLPPLPEQRKIADILSTWDEALTQLDALIEAQERRKKALMQQLLTGRRRLKGFDKSKGKTASDRFGTYPADWKRIRLGEITREVPTKNAEGTKLPVLSCTKHHGLVLSEEYFGKRVYAEDTSGYRVVQRGEFAYATNHIEEGSIGYQNLCEAGLVSPIYTVFKTTDAVDDSYLFRVLKSPLLIHFYQINTSASVDRRGSLRYDEFSRIHIWLPGIEEQKAIAKVFDTADQQLTLLRTQRTALDQQKRGLMQRLLTGKVRVKTD